MPRPDDRDEVLRLALPDPALDAGVVTTDVVVTMHAIQRYRERVEAVSEQLTLRRLHNLLVTAEWRSRPGPGPRSCCTRM